MSTDLRAALERLRDKLPDEWHPWASEQADEAHGYNDALHRVVEVINEEIEALATPEPALTADERQTIVTVLETEGFDDLAERIAATPEPAPALDVERRSTLWTDADAWTAAVRIMPLRLGIGQTRLARSTHGQPCATDVWQHWMAGASRSLDGSVCDASRERLRMLDRCTAHRVAEHDRLRCGCHCVRPTRSGARRMSNAELLLATQLDQAGIQFVREFRFAPPRRWRADFSLYGAGPILVEIDGGGYVAGRHSRGAGMEKDAEKQSAAAILGYRVIRCTPSQVEDGRALAWIQEAIAA